MNYNYTEALFEDLLIEKNLGEFPANRLVSYGVKAHKNSQNSNTGDTDNKSAVRVLADIISTGRVRCSLPQPGLYEKSEFDAFLSTSTDLFSVMTASEIRPVGVVLDANRLRNHFDKVMPDFD